ncbi:MAG: tRNA pseudouridine(38-40) synthase TruA [Eubacterium sp.]|nr:tRNA pseudouridine(38-40) synthase TruA [Eubacterium sp.]
MKRIRLIVSYDGTNYCGWQVQDNGITIEGVLNRELSALLGEEVEVTGASRTDSGVHALGNVCIFDTGSRIPPEKFAYALNARLPQDIRVVDSCEVDADFHPHHRDSIKTYEYKIWNDRFMNPVMRLYTKFCYYDLDTELMEKAGQYLVGEHDFKSFCSSGSSATTTVRTVKSLSVRRDEKEPRLITIRVTGYGFLYNMVRIIAGTLIEVGSGQREAEDVKRILEACDRTVAGKRAEAEGLTLVKIEYLE